MRRNGILVLAAVLAVAMVSLVGVDAGSGAAQAKARTLTKTFVDSDPIVIADNNPAIPYPATIDVDDRAFRGSRIRDVDVKLRGYEHALSDDTDVMLVGPKGQNALIFSDVGGDNSVSGLTFTLDDAAARRLPDATEPVSGTFRPTDHALQGDDDFPSPAPTPGGSSLSVFNGTNPTGTWQLFVFDDNGMGQGRFAGGWSLRIGVRPR